MKFINWVLIVFCLIFLSPLRVSADFSRDSWQYYREIEPAGEEEQKFVKVEIDGVVMDHADPALKDLRIINDLGKEVPYYLSGAKTASSRILYQTEMLNKSIVAGEYTTFILDLGDEKKLHNEISLELSGANYLRRAELEGSDDQSTWHQMEQQEYIYAVNGQTDNTIKYPKSNFRYLRVKIWDKGEKPLDISAASVYLISDILVREKLLTDLKITKTEEPGETGSIFLIDLGYRHMPTHRIDLITDSVNFQRNAEILGSNDGQDWLPLGKDFICVVDIDKFQFNKLNLEYPEKTFRYLKIIIDNQDNQPLNISGFQAASYPRVLLFPYEFGRKYQLYYGNARASVPGYDIKDLVSYIDQEELLYWSLGQEQKNPDFSQRTQQPWSEENKWLLLLVLAAVVSGLGYLIVRMLKNISHTSN